jgi:hypothetical protein
VTIDDFSLISAGDEGIKIGSYVPILYCVCLIYRAEITIHDFVSIIIIATILSSNSDFSGNTQPSLNEFQFNDSHKGLVVRYQ